MDYCAGVGRSSSNANGMGVGRLPKNGSAGPLALGCVADPTPINKLFPRWLYVPNLVTLWSYSNGVHRGPLAGHLGMGVVDLLNTYPSPHGLSCRFGRCWSNGTNQDVKVGFKNLGFYFLNLKISKKYEF